MTAFARICALAIALAALAGHLAQFMVSRGENPTALATIWSMARYFTVLTNLVVMLLYGAIAARGRAASQRWLGAGTLWITIVGIVFWALINDWTVQRSGADFWANTLYHTIVPIGAALWWLSFAPKDRLRASDAALWLAWPGLYAAYAVARGLVDGIYPYFFLDLGALGWGGLAKWVAILLVAFWLGALGLVALARGITRRGPAPRAGSAPAGPRSR